MNKAAIIRTQLIRQLKAIGLFLIVYCIVLGLALVFNEYGILTVDFETINFFFILYLVITNWLIFSKSLVFYSYHSFERLSILNRTVIVQLIVSCIASLLIEGHYVLMSFLQGLSDHFLYSNFRHIYVNDLVANESIRIVITIVLLALFIFSLLLFTDFVLLWYYSTKRNKAIFVIGIIIITLLAIFISYPYWPKSVVSIIITGGRYAIGFDQLGVPNLTIPVIIALIVAIVSYLLSRKLIRKIEVYKTISI